MELHVPSLPTVLTLKPRGRFAEPPVWITGTVHRADRKRHIYTLSGKQR